MLLWRKLLTSFLFWLARAIAPASLQLTIGEKAEETPKSLKQVMRERNDLYDRVHKQLYLAERVRTIDFAWTRASAQRFLVCLSAEDPKVAVMVYPEGADTPKDQIFSASHTTVEEVCRALLGESSLPYRVHNITRSEGSVFERLADIESDD